MQGSRRQMAIGLAAHTAMIAPAMASAGAAEPEPETATGTVPDAVSDHPLPGRLSIDRDSPFYTSCGSFIGLKVDGEDVTGRVVEYNVAMGWVRLVDRALSGHRLNISQVKQAPKSFGKVEPYWRVQPSRQVRRQLARIT